MLKVVTLNGSGVDLASATAAAALRNVGYKHAAKGILAVTGNGDTRRRHSRPRRSTTRRKRAKSAATKLQVTLFDANIGPAPAVFRKTTPRADVVVVVGKNFDASQVKSTVTPPPVEVSEPAAVSPIDPSLVKEFRFKQKYVHFPLLVPKVVPTGTTFGEPDSTDGWLRHYRSHGDWMLHATAYTSRRHRRRLGPAVDEVGDRADPGRPDAAADRAEEGRAALEALPERRAHPPSRRLLRAEAPVRRVDRQHARRRA